MKIDRTELRKGVADTVPFVLSHHLPSERYRCYSPTVFGRRLHLCARCLGIYPGIVLGFFAHSAGYTVLESLSLAAVLPLPALVDWVLTTYTERRGYNIVRTTTGLLLGYGYGLGLALVFLEFDPRVFVVGIAYAVAAGLLLYVDQHRR